MVRSSLRVTLLHVMEIAAGVAAVMVVLVGVLFWQLSKGPVSFGRFTSQIESILSASGNNIDVKVSEALLVWSQEDRTINLTAVDVEINDGNGILIGQVPTIEIDVSIPDLLKGRMTLTRIELQGPSAMIVRRRNGTFELGFPQEAEIKAQPVNQGRGKVFSWLIDELNSETRSRSPIASLQRFTISDAEIEFYDETSGSLWVAPRALVSIARGQAGLAWNMSGDVRIGPENVQVTMIGHIDPQTNEIDSSLEFSDFSPASFASKSNYFSDLSELNFPIRGEARIQIDSNGELKHADLELAVGEGSFRFAEFGEEIVPVEYGAFSAEYDGDRQWFDIRRLHFVAGENKATLGGTAQVSFTTEQQFKVLGFRFDLSGQDLSFNLPVRMKHVVSIDDLNLQGVVDFENRRLRMDRFALEIDKTSIELQGDLYQAVPTPAVIATGTLKNLPTDMIDVLWPRDVALGARDWITTNIDGGLINRGDLAINAAVGDFADLANHPDAVNFVFDVQDAAVTYVKGLPRMVDAAAEMVLTGETFDLTLKKGRVTDVVEAPLTVGKGSTVRIEHLSIKGSPILIETTLSGATNDILTLIDQPPLGYLKRFGADPQKYRGQGRAKMSFSIPSLRHVPLDDIGFKAAARVDDLDIPDLFADLSVNGGFMELDIDLQGLTGRGEILIEGAPTKVTWDENFRTQSGDSSNYVLDLNLNPSTQIDWGLDTGGAVTGDVPVRIVAKGSGSNISEVRVKANLTPASIQISSMDYYKETGRKAEASMLVKFTKAGELHLQDFEIVGEALGVEGSMSLARDGKLQDALFKRIWIDDFVDVRFRAERDSEDQLLVSIIGDYFNIAPFLEDLMVEFGGGEPAVDPTQREFSSPWTFEAQVNDLYLRQGVALRDVVFDISSDGKKFTSLDLSGAFHDSGTVFASLVQDEGNRRSLTITSSDGGRIIKGITGVDQMVGGEMSLKMQFDDDQRSETKQRDDYTETEVLNAYALAQARAEDGAELSLEDEAVQEALKDREKSYETVASTSTMTGYLKVDNFKIVKAPMLAQLLTVGSLRGLADTLNGDGIHFQSLKAPFTVNDEGVIGISDATASGSALGLTLVGTFDQGNNTTDFQGTIVPSYALNSALGNLPILGPMLVSRTGEGIFAFTYGINGPTSGPTVYVNPLSGLAPGFFRRIFQGGDQREATRVPVENFEETDENTESTEVQ
ncbi:MAG: hypothetical protein EP340_04275 [Alphaproteobacteria bacterium]|nr:MAG: hypothetical protein EP340_04275 [Alphaproteobacteria bacterium]